MEGADKTVLGVDPSRNKKGATDGRPFCFLIDRLTIRNRSCQKPLQQKLGSSWRYKLGLPSSY